MVGSVRENLKGTHVKIGTGEFGFWLGRGGQATVLCWKEGGEGERGGVRARANRER